MRVCTKCKISKEVVDFYKSDKRKSWCIACCRENVRSWQLRNVDKISEYNKMKYKSDEQYKESSKKRAHQHYLSHRDSSDYKHRKASREGKRRARKLNATPKWLSKDQLDYIDYLYWLCSDLKATTGQNYEVDHIVPLQGRNVCGLHVPWNLQVLPAELNRRKQNSYEEGIQLCPT